MQTFFYRGIPRPPHSFKATVQMFSGALIVRLSVSIPTPKDTVFIIQSSLDNGEKGCTMAGRPYVLAETTWSVVKDTPYEVAVLPWGAIEAHNLHLPYATDLIESDRIAAEAAGVAWEQGPR